MSILDCNHDKLKQAQADAQAWQDYEDSKFRAEELSPPEPSNDIWSKAYDDSLYLAEVKQQKHMNRLLQQDTNRCRERYMRHQLKIRCR